MIKTKKMQALSTLHKNVESYLKGKQCEDVVCANQMITKDAIVETFIVTSPIDGERFIMLFQMNIDNPKVISVFTQTSTIKI